MPGKTILKVTLIVVPFLFVGVYLLAMYKAPFTIISSHGLDNHFVWKTYTDKLHQGNSIITKTSNTNAFEYQYCLKDGYRYKFSLIGISPKDSNNVDLSIYNQLDITIKAKNGKGILFYLYTAFPENKKIKHPSWPHQYILNTDAAFTKIRLSFDQFYTPDWWYTEVNETKANLGLPLFKETVAMSFGNCIHIKPDITDVVTVKNMTFTVNLWYPFLKTVPYVLCYYLLLAIYYTFSKRKKKKLVFMETTGHAGSNDKNDEQLVLNFIGTYYFEPDYSIEQLSQQTGLPENKIAQIIKDKTSLTFKQFLNNIRITEAERLLEQTDLPVNELSDKVGFKSREHFGRLFKSKTGLNPLEVRKQKGKQIKYENEE